MNRASFLARVRHALGRSEGDPVAPPPPPAPAERVAPGVSAGKDQAALGPVCTGVPFRAHS